MRDIARKSVSLGNSQRFHKVPTREIRTPYVADLACPHEGIEHTKSLLHGRQRIETMQLIEVDIVGSESPQTAVHRIDQMVARGTNLIGAIARWKSTPWWKSGPCRGGP